MSNRFSRYLWVVLAILAVALWFNRDRVSFFEKPRPKPESLDFNRPDPEGGSRAVVISADEKVNMDVFESVHPAVVNIATTTLGMNFWMEIIPREGQGSGFVIDRNGYILTNNHVVAKAQKTVVTMANGRKIEASLVGRDPTSDLAVIKIPAKDVDSVARLGDSDALRVGQKAIAIGNPFGLSHTFTTGTISALRRGIRTGEGGQIDDLIQTDAAINPGNSGGPLLNSSAEVVGINTAIFSLTGGYQGIGFAIPINRAKEVASELIASGRVSRPWLGITGVTLTKGLSEDLGLDVDEGVLIVDVVPGSPADRAGLRGGQRERVVGSIRLRVGGDVVTGLEDKRTPDMNTLIRILDTFKPGQTVTLKILRDQAPVEHRVTLAERP